MHEVAMHVDHNVEEFKPPFSEETLDGGVGESGALTPSHIGALSTCLTSIDGIFETFLRFDIETVRCLPVAQFVRVAYAVVVLIKMYFAAATPNSELGKVINKDNMKVEQYLDGLVEIFKASAAEEKSRPSAKFLMVLIMLKTWFNRQREGKGTQPGPQSFVSASSPGTLHQEALAETPSESHQNARQNAQQRQQPGFSPANTPLQLLSEVATGNSGQSRSEGNAMYPPSNEWYPTQPQRPYTPGYDPMNPLAPLPQAYTNVGMSGNIDPSLGIDLGYAMGDGFEQAMGMTLGVGDFGTYFGDDIFGSLMDSVGGNPQGFEGF